MNGPAVKTDLPSARNVRLPIGIDREKLEKRFWAKVNKEGPNGCWIWKAGKNVDGYGCFHIGSGSDSLYSRTRL